MITKPAEGKEMQSILLLASFTQSHGSREFSGAEFLIRCCYCKDQRL